MAADTDNIKHLKEWYKKARNSGLVLNFALALGKKDDGMMIFVDKRKPAKKLLLDAKDEGETNKFAYGTMRVQKDEVFLTCEKNPPSGTAKRVKKYLKLIKMPGAPSRVSLVGDDGAIFEADIEADSGAPAQAAPAQAAPTEDPLKTKFEAALKTLQPKALARIKAGGPVAEKMKDAMKMVHLRAKKGDYNGGLKALAAVQKLIKTPDPKPQAAKPLPGSPKGPDLEPSKDVLALQARLVASAKTIKASELPKAETARLAKAVTKARSVLKSGREETCETLLNLVDRALATRTS